MARMGDIEREALEAVRHAGDTITEEVSSWFSHETGEDPYASPETSALAPTIEPATAQPPQEDQMTLGELEQDAKALAAKFETVDHDALAKLEVIMGNPEAMNLFGEVARLAGHPGVTPAILNGAALLLQAVAA